MKIKVGTKFALISPRDFKKVSQYKWFVKHEKNCTPYAVTEIGRFMHRLILDAPANKMVDHKNGNGLDNRRSNIRLCTNSQNNMNSKIHRNNKSGYKGVYQKTGGKTYIAAITKDKKTHVKKGFKTALEAANYYEGKAEQYFGEFAYKASRKK